MLYLDGISLNKIKGELEGSLLNKSINKITQTSALAITLNFGKIPFIISCFPSLPLCYISNTKEENILEDSSNFSLNLKKYLLGASLISIKQIGFDRILVFTFSKVNELGEVKTFKLFFEIMGKHSNLILTDKENKIIDSIKRFSLEESNNRVLFPGTPYSKPNLEEKISPAEITEEKFLEEKENKTILKNIQGIGKFLENNLENFSDLKNILSDESSPKIFFNEYDEIVLATVLNISPRNFSSVKTFENSQEMINEYINSENLSNTFKLLKDKLLNCIKKEIKKSEKIILSINKDLEEKKDFDKFRELGDVLASSLYSVKKGMKEIELYNFYTDSMCKIELDPLLMPQQNLEKIYKKYNKLKKGYSFNQQRLIEITNNLKYFSGIEANIGNSDSKENLKFIEEELLSQGILKISQKKNKKPKKESKLQVKSFGEKVICDIPITYGRNNTENDLLTNRVANREDTWFHCKDIPGTHIIVNQSYNLTEEQIYEIAVFCGQMSKLPKGSKVTVDYTKVKYLNKPKGARPGFVTYNIFKTIIVTI